LLSTFYVDIDTRGRTPRQQKMLKLMTPSQSRAARALINLTQPKLAEAAGVGLSTVVDFEKSRRAISADAQAAIQRALEDAGVEFIAENGGGPGVRLRNHRGEG